jgi:Ca2+-binding EF-hand superfamily protein
MLIIFVGMFCRSNNAELDENIFKIFDLGKTGYVDEEELTMMLINFPDIGFSNSQNIN